MRGIHVAARVPVLLDGIGITITTLVFGKSTAGIGIAAWF